MQINQFIMICLIVITIVAVTIFIMDIASNLVEWIMGIIFTAIVSVALSIGSIVIGLLSCVVFVIGDLIVYLKKKFRKRKK